MHPVDSSILPPQIYPRPSKKTLHGSYCVLQPFDSDTHTSALYKAFLLDEEGTDWTYLPHGPFSTEAAFSNWVHLNCLKEEPFFYTVCTPENLHPVGFLSLLKIEPQHGKLEIAHVHFSPLLKKTAASTEALYLIMKLVFDEMGYRRVEWKCDNANEGSKRCALRLGFTFEGLFRQHWIIKSRNRDTAWFSIIDKEWPEIRAKIERWLNPSNFKENGQQIKKLSDL